MAAWSQHVEISKIQLMIIHRNLIGYNGHYFHFHIFIIKQILKSKFDKFFLDEINRLALVVVTITN